MRGADRPSYLPALDGLRAIAVLLVMWGHVPPQVPGYPEWLMIALSILSPGELGVEIFFVLSGFLITRILLAERRERQPLRWFLLRRLLRIFPIYYLLLVVMAFAAPGPALGWCAVYLFNFWAVWHPGSFQSFLPHTWSLCIEEHFYLLWPAVVAFAPVVWARRAMAWLIMPAAVLGAVAVCHLVAVEQAEVAVRYVSPFRFLGLGCGCLMAFGESRLRARPFRAALLAAALLGLGVALWPVFWIFSAPGWFGTGLPLRYGPALWLVHSSAFSAGIVLCVIAASFAGSWTVRPLATWLPRSIGRISYGLYLYHFPIYALVMFGALSVANVALGIAATIAVATASYWVIERPLLRLGSRFR